MRTRNIAKGLCAAVCIISAAFGVNATGSSAMPDSVIRTPHNDSIARPDRQTVGLVLSGGGAKGIAHVGVIKALEENNIPIDYVTGTSMGAIVGSLYSCGWSPERMLKFFTSPDFGYWSTGTIPPERVYYYIQPVPTPKWLEVNINFKSGGKKMLNEVLPTSLISPLPMNIEFLNLYGPYSEQCGENFNNLFVPFRCVTSDVYHKHKIVLSRGSLGDAVRASMSFPLVFRPIKLDGVLVYDGGIYDNFPVNVMEKDFHPDFMIGVQVAGADKAPMRGDLYSQLEDMIIQNNDYSMPSANGIKIKVPVSNFAVLQFDKAREIYEIGYKSGLAMIDSIKKRVTARRTPQDLDASRAGFAAKTPDLKFDSIAVTGATPDQARYLRFLFFGGRPHAIGMPGVINSYYRAVTDGTLNNLVPQAEFGKDGHNTLLLQASQKRPWNIGVGGWISSSTNSMLYLKFGYHSMSFNSMDVSVSGWVGQSYYAGLLSARFTFPSARPSLVQLDGLLSRQKYYDSEVLFYQTGSPAFITEDENYLRGSYIWAASRKVKGWVSAAWGYMNDRYFPDSDGSYHDRRRDRTRYWLGVLRVGFEKNTLNNKLYPSEGVHWNFEFRGAFEKSSFYPENVMKTTQRDNWNAAFWAYYKHFFPVHRNIKLGVMGNAMGNYKKLKQNYTSTLVHSAEFAPTPSTQNYFNEAFRSDNFVAVGLIPVWTPSRGFQIRGDFYGYSKVRGLKNLGPSVTEYGKWFPKVEFIGEVAAVYNFPFASLSLYVNYLSSPKNNWNFGINFGLFFQVPKLIH